MNTILNDKTVLAESQPGLKTLPPRITAAFYLALVAKGNLVATRAMPGGVVDWLLVTSERQTYMMRQSEFEAAQAELDRQRRRVEAVRCEGVDEMTFLGAAVLLSIEALLKGKGVAV